MRNNGIAFVMNTFSLNWITTTVWLKSFKFFGKTLLDIVLQYEAILEADSLEWNKSSPLK